MVGATGFEPATSAPPVQRATKLHHAPSMDGKINRTYMLASHKFHAFYPLMEMIKTAVVGASGYTGMELLRLLLMHPQAELSCVTSRQYAGKTLSDIFPRFKNASGSELHDRVGFR